MNTFIAVKWNVVTRYSFRSEDAGFKSSRMPVLTFVCHENTAFVLR